MYKKSCLLPRLHRKDSHITRSRQTVFKGLSSCPHTSGQEIAYMVGLSARAYPAMGTLEKRFLYDVSLAEGSPRGLHLHDELVMAKGEGLYTVTESGELSLLCAVSDTDKVLASFGSQLFVLPDGLCCQTEDGTVRSLAADTGNLTDAAMGADYITHSTTDWTAAGFAVGDGVEIAVKDYVLGSVTTFHRKVTYIMNGTLFVEPSFERTGTFDMSVSRSFPELSHLFPLGDRLVGCAGHTIYLSEAGNPFNWTVRQDLESDPMTLKVGGAGDITACAAYQGDAVFFKEDRMYRLVGHSARDYVLTETAIPGVASGCAASLCEVDGCLFYLSAGGVYCLDGDRSRFVGQCLPQGLTGGVGGTDGVCYYLGAYNSSGVGCLYAYHKERDQWYAQDTVAVAYMASRGDLLFLQPASGQLLRNAREGETLPTDQTKITEVASALPSSVIFGDEFGNSPDGLRLHSVHLRVSSEGDDALLAVMVSYDRGSWKTIQTVSGNVSGWVDLPVYPRRAASYRLRLDMTGQWKIFEIICDYERGKQ